MIHLKQFDEYRIVMNDILEKFKELNKKPDVQKINKKVLFLSVPRSGSTYLCDILSKLEIVGTPDEWLNPAYIVELPQQIIDLQSLKSIQQFAQFLVRKTATPNGVFSLNLHLSSHEWWTRNGFNWLELIDFDVIYFISRRDKYAQAYSYAIAHQKNKWRQTEDFSNVELVEDLQFHHILQFLTTILNLEKIYESNIKHLVHREFVYEDFCANLEETIQLIGKDLQLDIQSIPQSDFKIQRKGYAQDKLAVFRSFMQSKLGVL
jgi:LPS sulfotransferase NodH